MEKLLELLKQKFSGVRQDVLAQLASSLALVATTEDEQNTAVEKLTSAQVEAFGKDYRKTVDAEVSNGTKTFEENLKKKYDFVEKGKKDPTPPTPPTPQEPNKDDERFVSLQKTIDELKGTIAGMKKDEISKSRSARYGEILNELKDENMKSVLQRQITLLQSLDDEAFETELNTLKSDVEKSNQLYAERSLPSKTYEKHVVDEKQVSDAMKAYVEKMNGETKTE